jgi:hypothetical protein
MSEVILAKVIETCRACPAQWDAWDLDGNYWYLRYRSNRGSAERQPSPDLQTWTDGPPNMSFDTTGEYPPMHGVMDLPEFCRRAGLGIHPRAELVPPPASCHPQRK